MKNFNIDSFAMGVIFSGVGIFLAGVVIKGVNLGTHLAEAVGIAGSALVVVGNLIL